MCTFNVDLTELSQQFCFAAPVLNKEVQCLVFKVRQLLRLITLLRLFLQQQTMHRVTR